MEENTVVTNVVDAAVAAAPVVEEVVNTAAIQPVVPPTIVVPTDPKNFLGLTNRQMKDAGVVAGISIGSVMLFEGGKRIVKAIPNAVRKAKEIWTVATSKTENKPAEQPAPAPTPEPAPAPQPVPVETPAPEQVK